MGQTISRLNDKYFGLESSLNKQESKSMLNDITLDDSDLITNMPDEGEQDGHLFENSKTPPNVLKLKCDPRSPTNFDRTPLKVPLDEKPLDGF